MALVVSVQRLAPLLSTTLTSERPQVHIQRHHAGEPAACRELPAPAPLGSGWGLGSDGALCAPIDTPLFPAFARAVPSIQNVLSPLT